MVIDGIRMLASSPMVRGIGTGLHLLAAAGCLAAARRGRRRFWAGLCVLQVLMAVDAAAGVRNAVGEMAREAFRAHGMYGQRWWPQAVLSVLGVVVVGIAAGGMVWRLRAGPGESRREVQACRVAAAGTGLSLALMVLTAVSLHPVEAALGWPMAGFNVGVLLRGVGAMLVVAGAWWFGQAGRLQS